LVDTPSYGLAGRIDHDRDMTLADEVDPQQLAEQLLAQAKAQGVDLVGRTGS
jgi:hypothetical protein